MTDSTKELDGILDIHDNLVLLRKAADDDTDELRETTKQAILDWHNEQIEAAERKAYQRAYMVMTDADLTEVQALDCLLKLSGNVGLIFSEAERNKLKEAEL